jgi:2-polyprenyl-3-methyl-5-hydroxy-6-metoxy-1,4-benzoquinol methylase
MRKRRVLVFIVAYNAESTLESVIRRIPGELAVYDTHILVIDDSSRDRTFERASALEGAPFPMTALCNPVNQGYGGNQKIGFHYAVKAQFDAVALLHGDGQYAPECLPELLDPLLAGEADAVFGSRMMVPGAARRGGMPMYKRLGNRILTAIQNRVLNTSLSEFHTGYRVYSVKALERIPFERNTNDFHFDTEIILQLLRAGFRIKEVPIPTHYGDEVCHVNGLAYALNVVKATLVSRVQDLGILYERKYDVTRGGDLHDLYRTTWGFESPQTLTLGRVRPGAKVLDVGCASGYMARALRDQGCEVTGIDTAPPPPETGLKAFIRADLNDGFPIAAGAFDYVLLLDVIEHVRSPEAVVDALRNSEGAHATEVIVSTANVAFFIPRLMLLLGYFHYSARGILDVTHTRLFTFGTLQDLFDQAGYRIEAIRGVPAPFPIAFGNRAFARGLMTVNRWLIRLSKSLFSYQIFMIARPAPSLGSLLTSAIESSRVRTAGEASSVE